MIVDTMSYSEIRNYIFDNKPDDDRIRNFFYKNLRKASLKLSNGSILNTMYVANIKGITYYAVFQRNNKLDFSAALFAKFSYKNTIRIVSLSPYNNTIQWFTTHYRERVVERTSDDEYSLKQFFHKMIPLMNEVNDPRTIYCGNTGFVQNGMLHIVDTNNPFVIIYKTIIPLERKNYIDNQLIKSQLGEINYKKNLK